ncbi:MAG TPA: hypothetical protein VFK89_10535, partial [Actinomycetota bacterium]|nr:hypothetical protein [Actinomycetota bacterium]
MKPALSAVIAATLLVSCGGGIDDGAAPEPTSTTDATPASPDPGTEYEATGFVLQAGPDADPKLCLGGVMESYPPQCG